MAPSSPAVVEATVLDHLAREDAASEWKLSFVERPRAHLPEGGKGATLFERRWGTFFPGEWGLGVLHEKDGPGGASWERKLWEPLPGKVGLGTPPGRVELGSVLIGKCSGWNSFLDRRGLGAPP
jgi:hypothetical protein